MSGNRYFVNKDVSFEKMDTGSGGGEETYVIPKETIAKVKYQEERYGKMRKKKWNNKDDKAATIYSKKKKNLKKKDVKSKDEKYPGRAPVNPDLLDKHSRGPEGVVVKNVKTKFYKNEIKKREAASQLTEAISARSELLLDEDVGYMEGDERLFTTQIKQKEIREAVDKESAAKGFELNLAQFGPYKMDYTRNGRHLVIGGRKGHVAAFDWQSKNLMCEINVTESVHDVQWFHTEQMFAVAQKKWTYVYDNQGIELHCLKKLDNINKLEFLLYHFLLVGASERGFLSWVDVSKGTLVSQYTTKMGRLDVMCQNPYNAVIICGHSQGTVTMWTPNVKEKAVVKILCHRQPIRAVAIEKSGTYMATAAVDRSLKIWDIRNTYQAVQDYKINAGASGLSFSGNGLLAVSLNNTVEIYSKDICKKSIDHPYMRHKVFKSVSDISFAPYEDVLGIGHGAGFSSILVPGSGIANFDALEVNPFQTKKQRREAEVKSLLEKIQPELITLDPTRLGDIDSQTMEEKLEERNAKLFLKPSDIKFEPRNKGNKGTAKQFHIKRTSKDEERRKNIKKLLQDGDELRQGKTKQPKKPKTLLDRL